jgi:hypothetical protein
MLVDSMIGRAGNVTVTYRLRPDAVGVTNEKGRRSLGVHT